MSLRLISSCNLVPSLVNSSPNPSTRATNITNNLSCLDLHVYVYSQTCRDYFSSFSCFTNQISNTFASSPIDLDLPIVVRKGNRPHTSSMLSYTKMHVKWFKMFPLTASKCNHQYRHTFGINGHRVKPSSCIFQVMHEVELRIYYARSQELPLLG